MKSVDVAVLGSTGYAGEELVSILEQHPNVSSIQAPSREALPEFDSRPEDTVFLALPHGEAGTQAARFRELGSRVIDLSGDLRFPTAADYERWYGQPHPAPNLLPAIYALPEHHRDKLPGRKLASIPGCYPTATLLGLLPLLQAGLLKPGPIKVNAVSGTSGMGKRREEEAKRILASGQVQPPYARGRQHRHVGEIEQFLEGRQINFNPRVGPFRRGLLAEITTELVDECTGLEEVHSVLQDTYSNEPFVEVLEPFRSRPSISAVQGTDICQLGMYNDGEGTVISSSLDNLRKGAASQAIQAFNLMHGLPETTGLTPKKGWTLQH